MFQKTKWRLVLLNSIVFFVLFNGFAASLYFYMDYRLTRQVDLTLKHANEHMKDNPAVSLKRMKGDLDNDEKGDNHQILVMMWHNQTSLVSINNKEHFFKDEIKVLEKNPHKKGFFTYKKENQVFRILTVPTSFQMKVDGKLTQINEFQLVYNMHQEGEMLEHLFMVMCIGSIFSIIIAVTAGVYLANRALTPIKLAWDKQSSFVSDASHELRTPLSVIKLNLERLFRFPERSIEQESEKISASIHEINYMTKMVADLLTLARSDSNQLELINEQVNLSEVLKQAVAAFKELAAFKGIHLSASIESNLIMFGDRERLYQLSVILLDNALKYSKEQGEIIVSCVQKGTQLRLEVMDTGIGIAEDEMSLIFDRFYRSDDARTRKYEGTGLGLSIGQWIVQLHHGKIKVESEVGKGTNMIVTFPIAKIK